MKKFYSEPMTKVMSLNASAICEDQETPASKTDTTTNLEDEPLF
jgi:hypothetical protein